MKNINLKHLFKKNFTLILLVPLILNFLYNLFTLDFFQRLLNFDLINLGSTLILFFILFFVGKATAKTFNFQMISTGILFYFCFMFLFDNVFLFVSKNFSFSILFYISNALFFIYLLLKKKSHTELILLSLFFILNLGYVQIFFEEFNFSIIKKGDVAVQWFPMAQNIYNNNYFFSLTSPFLDGYGQLISYTHAVLLKINLNLINYEYVRSTTNVLYFLSIFLMTELKISKNNKILSILIFTILILNSDWLNYLFIDSLMGEGIVSYFFAVAFLSVFNSKSSNSKIILTLFGTIYFTKQFVTILVLIVCFSFFIFKKTRKSAVYAFIPFFVNEINLITNLTTSRRDAYASNFDFRDTILDLLTNTNLKLENAVIIFKNLIKDVPFTYLLVLFILSLIFYIIKSQTLSQEFLTLIVTFTLNLLFIVLLYISAWRNMPELESPIRYMLNLFHLVVAYIFINIDFFENSTK